MSVWMLHVEVEALKSAAMQFLMLRHTSLHLSPSVTVTGLDSATDTVFCMIAKLSTQSIKFREKH